MALCYNFSRMLRIVGLDRWRALLAQRAAKPLGWLIVAVLRIYHRAARPGAVLVEQLTRVVFLDVQRQVHDNVTADLLAQPRSADPWAGVTEPLTSASLDALLGRDFLGVFAGNDAGAEQKYQRHRDQGGDGIGDNHKRKRQMVLVEQIRAEPVGAK